MITQEIDISTSTTRTIQFENANEGRSYPFCDDTVLEDMSGKTLPEGFLCDARLVIPSGCSAFLSSAYITENMLSVCISVTHEGSRTGALSVIVSKDSFSPYVPYRLCKMVGSEDLGGVVTFGNIAFENVGDYRFRSGQAVFSPSAVATYQPSRVRAFIDPRTGASVHGDVRIDFQNHVDAKIVDMDDSGDSCEGASKSVYLSLKEGSASALMSDCDKNTSDTICGTTPISRINGIRPDDKNRIVLWFH